MHFRTSELKMSALLVVAHPDDCIIFGWHIIKSIEIKWEILYLTHNINTPRGIEISNFWAKEGIKTHFLGHYDDPDDRTNNKCKISPDDVINKLEKFVEGKSVLCTHNSIGEYYHPHHILVNKCVSEFTEKILITFEPNNFDADLIFSASERPNLSLLPLHKTAIEHFSNEFNTTIVTSYNTNKSISHLIRNFDFTYTDAMCCRILTDKPDEKELIRRIKKRNRKNRSALVYKELANYTRKFATPRNALKYYKISKALDPNCASDFDLALIYKACCKFIPAQYLLKKLYDYDPRSEYLVEIFECAIVTMDFETIAVYRHLLDTLNKPQRTRIDKALNKNKIVAYNFSNQRDRNFTHSKSESSRLKAFDFFIKNNIYLFIDNMLLRYLDHPISKSGRYQIFTYWDNPDVPIEIFENSASWSNHSVLVEPIYNHDSANVFIINNFGHKLSEIFKRLPHPASESDFFRLAMLLINGGIYIDADEYSLSNLNILMDVIIQLDLDLCFVCDTFSNQIYVQNHFIYSRKKNHPILADAFYSICTQLELNPNAILSGRDIWNITGPGNLTRSLIDSMNNSNSFNKKIGFISSTTFRSFFINKNKLATPKTDWRYFK